MYLDLYIASPDVPNFSWEQSDNPYDPKIIGHKVPESREAFFLLKEKIDEGIYPYVMTDWATWVAKVNKQQIIDFFKQLYGANFMHPEHGPIAKWKLKLKERPDQFERNRLKVDIESMSELLQTIQDLDDEKDYALVAQEF